jgi:hypothetical protein
MMSRIAIVTQIVISRFESLLVDFLSTVSTNYKYNKPIWEVTLSEISGTEYENFKYFKITVFSDITLCSSVKVKTDFSAKDACFIFRVMLRILR